MCLWWNSYFYFSSLDSSPEPSFSTFLQGRPSYPSCFLLGYFLLPHCTITLCRAPLKETFPWVAKNISTMKSLCSSFYVAMNRPIYCTPLNVVTIHMDNLYYDRTSGNLGTLMTMMMVTSDRTSTANWRKRRMIWNWQIGMLVTCGKNDPTHGEAPFPGDNIFCFFVLNEVRLHKCVCCAINIS